ncbi:MAG TPA: carboxypeptidase-like regulatory domain-containing protein [Pyrinomonadaceae bacterium]|nr:carboxypeptidase-like regulatory domain-containing protein [Pyrinomonadaceae bacterium]
MKVPFLANIIFAFTLISAASSLTMAQTYQGRATALKATVTAVGQPVLSTAFSDTGNLPDSGSGTSLTSLGLTVPGVATISSSNATTDGSLSTSSSTAGVNNLNITALSNTISASVVSSSTFAICPSGSASGSTTITGLTINGSSITVTGAPNQFVTIFLAGNPVGTLIINEQVAGPESITVNALHLFVTDPLNATTTDVVVASARSGITCSTTPAANRFSGYGTAVWLTQTNLVNGPLSTIIADTGSLPGTGGSLSSTTAGAGVSSLLTTGTTSSTSSGGAAAGTPQQDQSTSQVQNLGINALGVVTIGANVLTSNTQCQCTFSVPSCSGSSNIVGLNVTTPLGNLPITITGLPNQNVSLPLGLGNLILNARVAGTTGQRSRITTTALIVNLNVAGLDATNVRIADSDSGIFCGLAPSSSNATVSGRVTDQFGNGISGANIRLQDTLGFVFVARTNGLGNFSINDVAAGRTYVALVSHKRYLFESRLISVDDDIVDLDFQAFAPPERMK